MWEVKQSRRTVHLPVRQRWTRIGGDYRLTHNHLTIAKVHCSQPFPSDTIELITTCLAITRSFPPQVIWSKSHFTQVVILDSLFMLIWPCRRMQTCASDVVSAVDGRGPDWCDPVETILCECYYHYWRHRRHISMWLTGTFPSDLNSLKVSGTHDFIL